ncbi:sulfite exporter TauE/SafE family protein [Spirosoma endbachense]|uniref:Probable membrane transporter protein n=1 Tax=Spirosoma endbachense TaxID=2666025 RepID=A0A6P1VXM4_9BACT|nr:TSUP family transporter [Spirosoma endbachense]QHV96832.1 TSUP family transporter [Spirosoma endbachense]
MDYSTILTLCGFSFLAGFVDAIIGGGGLIQTPAILFSLPQYPVPTLIGSTKIPSLCGSLMGAFQYSRRVAVIGKFIGPMMVIAFGASWLGSWTLTRVPNSFMKPFALAILIAVFLYTLTKKEFGQVVSQQVSARQQRLRMWGMGAGIGFYDGFFGPGTGSFLVLGFIALIGFDFLKASAHAKLVNASTNLASTLFFMSEGKILYAVAFPMAVANLSGAFLGARLAILKGNQFIRVFFLLIITATIVRFGWDLFD